MEAAARDNPIGPFSEAFLPTMAGARRRRVYSYWLNGFLNTSPASVQGWLRGDFDYNGVIDPSPIPEPASIVLLVAWVVAWWAWIGHRRKRG